MDIKEVIASINQMQRILESKRALRRKLAARLVAEKLRMLDDLRERALTIRRASFTAGAESRVQETSGKYAPRPKEKKAETLGSVLA